VAKEYAALMTTRHRALQRPLDRIESLRQGERSRDGCTEPKISPLALDA
jgi:hypothetical protein